MMLDLLDKTIDGVFWFVEKFFYVFCALGFLLAVGLLLAGIMLPIRMIQHHYDVAQCYSFATASGFETKFVDYTWWTWDCLTPTRDGKWISTEMLRDVGL